MMNWINIDVFSGKPSAELLNHQTSGETDDGDVLDFAAFYSAVERKFAGDNTPESDTGRAAAGDALPTRSCGGNDRSLQDDAELIPPETGHLLEALNMLAAGGILMEAAGDLIPPAGEDADSTADMESSEYAEGKMNGAGADSAEDHTPQIDGKISTLIPQGPNAMSALPDNSMSELPARNNANESGLAPGTTFSRDDQSAMADVMTPSLRPAPLMDAITPENENTQNAQNMQNTQDAQNTQNAQDTQNTQNGRNISGVLNEVAAPNDSVLKNFPESAGVQHDMTPRNPAGTVDTLSDSIRPNTGTTPASDRPAQASQVTHIPDDAGNSRFPGAGIPVTDQILPGMVRESGLVQETAQRDEFSVNSPADTAASLAAEIKSAGYGSAANGQPGASEDESALSQQRPGGDLYSIPPGRDLPQSDVSGSMRPAGNADSAASGDGRLTEENPGTPAAEIFTRRSVMRDNNAPADTGRVAENDVAVPRVSAGLAGEAQPLPRMDTGSPVNEFSGRLANASTSAGLAFKDDKGVADALNIKHETLPAVEDERPLTPNPVQPAREMGAFDLANQKSDRPVATATAASGNVRQVEANLSGENIATTTPVPAPAAAEVAPSTGFAERVERLQDLLNHLDEHVLRTLNDKEKGMIIRLVPANLGRVQINCQAANDQIRVNMVVENGAVQNLIQQQENMLRGILQQAGYRLEQFDVRTHNEETGSRSFRERAQTGRRGRVDAPDTVRTGEVNERPAVTAGYRHHHADDGVWFVA